MDIQAFKAVILFIVHKIGSLKTQFYPLSSFFALKVLK